MQFKEEAKISRKRFRVPHGATILPLLSASICDNLLSNNNLKKSGHDKVVDRILRVWFRVPKKNVRFRFSNLFHKRWPQSPEISLFPLAPSFGGLLLGV